MEDIAAEFGDTPGFFQLYTPTDRELAASLVHRAEAAGYKESSSRWTPGCPDGDLATLDVELPTAARPLPGQLHQ